MSSSSRLDSRAYGDVRPMRIELSPLRYAEGSCVFHLGHTQVLCSATLENSLPSFLQGSDKGWVTAEYSMLPRATQSRSARRGQLESARNKEIQRLIGRSLRAVIDLRVLAGKQIKLDCDVISADGGTRVAALNGAYVALAIAIERLLRYQILDSNPLLHQLGGLSCGVWRDQVICDLCYEEDSSCLADANFVLSSDGGIIEIQASGEGGSFSEAQLMQMLSMARGNMAAIFAVQNEALAEFKKGLKKD